MNKYEETGKYPKGKYSDHVELMLKARNRGWTYLQLTKHMNLRFYGEFKVSSVTKFCKVAFKPVGGLANPIVRTSKHVDDRNFNNPLASVAWTSIGLKFLRATL